MNAQSRIWPDAFDSHKAAGLALLTSGAPLTLKAAQFCGGLTVTEPPLTEKQAEWLRGLLKRAGLPPMVS